jgi:hypothetical protein
LILFRPEENCRSRAEENDRFRPVENFHSSINDTHLMRLIKKYPVTNSKMHFSNKERPPNPGSTVKDTAGESSTHPSLCPAFRVRRGSRSQ